MSHLRLSRVILWVLLSFDRATKPAYTSAELCLQSLDFRPITPHDRTAKLTYCTTHEKRTCCEMAHTNRIQKQMLDFHEGGASEHCLDLTSNIMCSVCDGNVGVGKYLHGTSPIICSNLCTNWYNACINEYYAVSSVGVSTLQLCTDASVVCSKLHHVAKTAEEFCSKSGYKVGSYSGEKGSRSMNPCYAGIPAAVMYGPASKERPPRSSRSYKKYLMGNKYLNYIYKHIFSIYQLYIYNIVYLKYLNRLPSYFYIPICIVLWVVLKLYFYFYVRNSYSVSSGIWSGGGRLGGRSLSPRGARFIRKYSKLGENTYDDTSSTGRGGEVDGHLRSCDGEHTDNSCRSKES